MNAPLTPVRFAQVGRSSIAERLRRELDADVLFDAASRGRYSTDASIYQLQPIGIVVPRSEEAARGAIAIAAAEGLPILPRGAGSSQCGQAVGEALVIDHTKYLNRVLEVDPQGCTAVVQPGVVLDALNAQLRMHGLWFPVDVSTSAQATLGGMAGNNSCGSRSIAYGNMVHNVAAIEAVIVSGERWKFGPMSQAAGPSAYAEFVDRLKALYEREKAEIETRFPKLLRKVAGYNLDHLGPPHANAAHLLVGSEGTLAYSERLHLRLSRIPPARALGVCHFPRFYTAMDLTQHIVKLGPSAVELVDRTMIGLARDIAAFRRTVDAFIEGDPAGLLSGCAIAAKHLSPGIRVIGVEPEAGDDAARSFRSKRLVSIDIPQTIADGARTQALGALTFPLVLEHVDDIITVSDAQLVEAMRFLWERMKLVVEPTGALAAAGVLSRSIDVTGKRVGIILSGGNVDLKAVAALFAE